MSKVLSWHNAAAPQKMEYTIRPMPGTMMPLTSVGRQLHLLARAIESAGRAIAPEANEVCFLGGIDMAEDGAITFSVVVAPHHEPAPSPPPARGRDDADG